MRERGLFAQRQRHRTVTAKSEPGAPGAPNLLQRDESADQPNAKWVADTTSIWAAEGWLYLAVVLDLFSRQEGMVASMSRTADWYDLLSICTSSKTKWCLKVEYTE